MRGYIPSSLVGIANDKEAYLISSIQWQLAIKNGKANGYAPLKLTFLRRILGSRATRQVIAAAKANGWIKTDGAWMAGKVSMGYRLLPPFSREMLAPHEYRDEELVRRVTAIGSLRVNTAIGDRPELRWLYGNLDAVGFRTGIKGVIASQPDMVRTNLRIQAVGRIEDRDWWFSRDPRTGRVFHNVSTLPRDCRAKILIHGQPVAETDISNCQPFLLAGEYAGDCAERRRLLGICEAGRFYEELNGLLPVPYASRDDLKREVYKSVLYGTPWTTTQPFFQAFAGAFPVLAGRIKLSKDQEGHAALPMRMQRAEADLMIAGVLPKVMRAEPDCGALTIHDSLALPARYASWAAGVVKDELVARYGVSPPIGVK